MMLRQRRYLEEEAGGMDSKTFCELLVKKAKWQGGTMEFSYRNRYNDKNDVVMVTYINLPPDQARGANAMNNRFSVSVEGFSPELGAPPPTGKVKLKVMVTSRVFTEALGKVRGRTASPERMLSYLAKLISDMAKVEPVVR